MAVFLTVYLSDGPHTVRGLAQWLNVSKPAITRALDRLGELDIARRKLDPMDRRSVHVQRTIRGAELLQEVRETMAQAEKQTMDWIHCGGSGDPGVPSPPQTMAAFNPRG